MSKERLEEIISREAYLEGTNDLVMVISTEDYKWLIEQAERVQELEDKLARIRFVNNDYDKQNKRYREAREIIEQEYKEHNVGVVYGYEDGYLDGLDTAMDIIDKALEGEE